MRRITRYAHYWGNLPRLGAMLSSHVEDSRELIRTVSKKFNPPNLWSRTKKLFLIIVGTIIAALGYSIFQIPYNLAAGGLSGLSIIINNFTGWHIGILVLLLNVPLLIIGFIYLGQWRFLGSTVFSVALFSFATDMFTHYLPIILSPYPITHDMLLSAIYAGLVGGIGVGLIYRSGASPGGTAVLGQIIQRKTGMPLSQVYLYTDGIIIVLVGAVFGWEIALHAVLVIFLSGMAADFSLEGPSMVRTATIVTTNPDELSVALMTGLNRSLSCWEIVGGYSGKSHTMILCTILRSQVSDLKRIVAEVDVSAFVVIGNAHQALGTGFLKLKK